MAMGNGPINHEVLTHICFWVNLHCFLTRMYYQQDITMYLYTDRQKKLSFLVYVYVYTLDKLAQMLADEKTGPYLTYLKGNKIWPC